MTDPNIAQSAKKFERIRKAHQSEVAEDYVEMIADLIERTGEARAVDLASLFGVTAPTVNATIQRLQKDGLVISRPYRSIFLSPEGQQLAKSCKERHRIVRDFLIAIGVDRDVAEQDAEGVEHHAARPRCSALQNFSFISPNQSARTRPGGGRAC